MEGPTMPIQHGYNGAHNAMLHLTDRLINFVWTLKAIDSTFFILFFFIMVIIVRHFREGATVGVDWEEERKEG